MNERNSRFDVCKKNENLIEATIVLGPIGWLLRGVFRRNPAKVTNEVPAVKINVHLKKFDMVTG